MSAEPSSDDVIVQIGSPSAGINAGGVRGGGAAELGRRLLLAARAGDSRGVLALMAHGAPFAADWLGTSALHLAAAHGHAHTCGVLLRAGVSRDARTKVERTPLHVAAAAGHADVVLLLLQHGAAPHCRDMLGMTALHWAAQRGRLAAARALLAHGADPRAVSKFRHTPAMLAARAGHPALLALLQEYESAEDTLKLEDVLEESEQKSSLASVPSAPGPVPAAAPTASPAPAPPSAPAAPAAPTAPTAEARGWAGAAAGGAAGAALGGMARASPPPPTVLGAVASGRSLVLSDAGKIMLKESEVSVPASAAATAAPAPARPAAPAPAAPAPTRLVAISLASADGSGQQVKYLQIPADKLSPLKYPLKARSRAPRVVPCAPAAPGAPAAPAAAAGPKPTVKIIMNKANFSRLLAQNAVPVQVTPVKCEGGGVATVVGVAAAGAGGTGAAAGAGEAARLRSELAAARATIAALTDQLRQHTQR